MKTKIHIVNQKATRSIANPIPDGVNVLEELIADDGKKLTQSTDIDIKERIIATAVMLGKGCSSSEWIEITQEEANNILKQQNENEENKEENE